MMMKTMMMMMNTYLKSMSTSCSGSRGRFHCFLYFTGSQAWPCKTCGLNEQVCCIGSQAWPCKTCGLNEQVCCIGSQAWPYKACGLNEQVFCIGSQAWPCKTCGLNEQVCCFVCRGPALEAYGKLNFDTLESAIIRYVVSELFVQGYYPGTLGNFVSLESTITRCR